MAAPYLGKQDFRGYLNYLGSKGDTSARNYLNFVGNDYTGTSDRGVNQEALAAAIRGGFDPGQNTIKSYYDKYVKLNTKPVPRTNLPSIYGYGSGGGSGLVSAPYLDIVGLNAKARRQAAKSVNPFYTKTLNRFLAEQKRLREVQKAQYETDVKSIEEALDQTLEGNETSRTRTAEDVTQNVSEIADTQQQFQEDTGQQFDVARRDIARDTVASGLTGGIGAQKREEAVTQRNIQEKRQEKQFQQAKTQQQLFKNRTFEDLLRSDKLAEKGADKRKKQEKFDLDNYIKSQKYEIGSTKRQLEQQRQEALLSNQSKYAKKAFARFIAGLNDPAKILAAQSKYGSSF